MIAMIKIASDCGIAQLILILLNANMAKFNCIAFGIYPEKN